MPLEQRSNHQLLTWAESLKSEMLLKDRWEIDCHAIEFGTVFYSMAQQDPDPGWINYQRNMDDQNMRTLAILYKVYAGITTVIACCFSGYLLFIGGIFGLAASQSRDAAPAVVGGIAGVFWLFIVAMVGGLALLQWLTARWIETRTNWLAVVVVAAINCLNAPIGMALGIFTLIVITKPHVKDQFQA